MKTTGRDHQQTALRLMKGREFFALFCEQGTGKTWIFLAEAERRFLAGEIDALVVVAPKGVHINWIKREIPKHLEAPHVMAYYISGANKRDLKAINAVFDREAKGLKILTINFEALNTEKGFKVVQKFLELWRAVLVVDESSRIKNPSAMRSKRLMKLKPYTKARLIGSGTPITNAPTDAFSQFEFMRTGLLGTDSYRAFVAEYSELMPNNSRLILDIQKRTGFIPQIVARDRDGRPKWRNLDKLRKLIAPHSYRVLKRDCLDLPRKIYEQTYFHLTNHQRQIYNQIENELRIELASGIVTVNSLSAIIKCQQVTSCFVIADKNIVSIERANPRIEALKEVIEDAAPGTQFIIWAHFREELKQIAAVMKNLEIPFVEYHGGIPHAHRDAGVDAFQSGQARAFLGQPQAGGMGLTLTAAELVIYYSNDFNLETRLQSEDRAHRIGTAKPVVYVDLIAVDTVDDVISRALQNKESVAAAILNAYKKGK